MHGVKKICLLLCGECPEVEAKQGLRRPVRWLLWQFPQLLHPSLITPQGCWQVLSSVCRHSAWEDTFQVPTFHQRPGNTNVLDLCSWVRVTGSSSSLCTQMRRAGEKQSPETRPWMCAPYWFIQQTCINCQFNKHIHTQIFVQLIPTATISSVLPRHHCRPWCGLSSLFFMMALWN